MTKSFFSHFHFIYQKLIFKVKKIMNSGANFKEEALDGSFDLNTV